ncbi:MAG: hypothetical protein AseanaTS_28520 [Candidatus Pelagadaptatus aseana]|uniref:ammonium transporter n=1 Tax=Candidatus Pelagadaptatus aseana TaxID=3120508 RepID=UPI0039B162CD
MAPDLINILWLTLCGAFVLLMQAGFLCLESGVTRSKNAINVAMKNAADFVVAIFFFWLVGYGLMFGDSWKGMVGLSGFAPDVGQGDPWEASFFLFQAMFCATAATIVSGSIAERVRFNGYLILTFLIVVLVYPVAGHWAWAGLVSEGQGWLARIGFVDFAGSTVVHSVGGWVALVAVWFVGPRQGRFNNGQINAISGHNMPLAFLGVLFFVLGWIGFNGGSTLELNLDVPGIIANTILSGVTGSLVGYVSPKVFPRLIIDKLMVPFNGCLAGLVAITASCHAVTAMEAVVIGAVGGLVMIVLDHWMFRLRLDDAVGAIPVHLGAGIWGTLAVALFGDPLILATGLDFKGQLLAQLSGVVAIALWSLLVAFVCIFIINRIKPLRISVKAEIDGLNMSEHGARNDLVDLITAMDAQQHSADLSVRVPVEPFTEVGQIAQNYNKAMDALADAVKQTRTIVRDIRDGIVTFGTEGLLTSFNPAAEKVFGLSATEAIGQPVQALFHQERYRGSVNGSQLLEELPLNQTREVLGNREDQDPFHMEVTVTEGRNNGRAQYTAVFRDVHEKRQMEEQLYHEKERALVTLGSIADGVITTDEEGRVVFLNHAAETITGWSFQEACDRHFSEVYRIKEGSFNDSNRFLKRALLGMAQSFDSQGVTLVSRDQREFAVNHTLAPIRGPQDNIIGCVAVFHDVTHTRDMQNQLVHQATHDALTGMLNRIGFDSMANQLLEQASLENHEHILGYMDLDQFKLVNDTCGHVAGDELLRQISTLIKEQLRSGDTIARLGGDEFGVLLRNCPPNKGVEIAEKVRSAIQDYRFSWDGKQFAIGVSIGLVPLSKDSPSLEKLLSLADSACYAAKDLGRNRVHLYQSDDAELAERQGQMHWVSKIREALDNDKLRLYYQPIAPIGEISAQSGHYEMFVRMIDDDGSVIPPGAFIPAAERYNQIQEIDLWVVKNALAWAGDMLRKQPESIQVCAINLSGASLGDESCLKAIMEAFKRYQVPHHNICFEITETAAIANLDAAQKFIRALKGLGCRFSLDDFGSGLSSFGYLKNLPVDYLKIDGAFIKDIVSNKVDQVMVQSINTIGHEMGLKTIAEFVESPDIVETLLELGIDYVQGYHIGRPMPLEQLGGVILMPR